MTAATGTATRIDFEWPVANGKCEESEIRNPKSEMVSGRGVTLLELVITLTILSLIGVIGLQAFRLGSRSWQKGEERAEAEQRIRVVYSMMAQALASFVPAMAMLDRRQVLAFQGGPEWIFFHTAPAGHGPLPYGAMVRSVAFSVEPGTGLVVQESYPLAEGEVSLQPRGPIQILDPQVTGLKFRYLAPPASEDQEAQWVETWDPNEGKAETPAAVASRRTSRLGPAAAAPATSRLPLAIEVTLLRAEGRGEREVGFVVPVRLGRSL